MRSETSLDALNFFLADVREGLGPYLAIYLLTERHWREDEIGLVMTVAGLAGIARANPRRGPYGREPRQACDHRRRCAYCDRRVDHSSFHVVLRAGRRIAGGGGRAAVFFAPAIAAISLGRDGSEAIHAKDRQKRNLQSRGQCLLAALAGVGAWKWGPSTVFFLLAAMAALSIASVLAIDPERSINARARGLPRRRQPLAREALEAQRAARLQGSRDVLPLLRDVPSRQRRHAAARRAELALEERNQGTALMSACIVAAQIVHDADGRARRSQGRCLGPQAVVSRGLRDPPLRGFLYTLSNDRYWLVAVQTLDGVGAGLYGALFAIVVADLTRGTGHFNLAQGAVITAQGLGAALSTTLAGVVVVHAGYSAAFLDASAR